MTLDDLLSRLHDVTGAAGQWQARCPAHEDSRASLSIATSDSGRILMCCHAGCSLQSVCQALGIEVRDLFGDAERDRGGRIVAVYQYADERGDVLYEVVRFEPKDFRQRQSDGRGGFTWKLGRTRRVPFRLPQLLAEPARPVVIVEGERDVESLERIDVLSSTNSGGAGKFGKLDRATVEAAFRGRPIAILPDNDPPGRDHARDVARRLHGIASEIRIVELPGLAEHGDVSDWLSAGGTREQLAELIRQAPPIAEAPRDEPKKKAKKGESGSAEDSLSPHAVAEDILDRHQFARDLGGELYVYLGGVYKPRGADFLRERVKALFVAEDRGDEWTSHAAEEVIRYILADAPELLDVPPLETINVENGLLDWRTETLRPHSPDHLSQVRIPVTYDPAATCPAWERFIAAVFPVDCRVLAWELAAWTMVPCLNVQQAVLLTDADGSGQGGTGKSTYLGALRAFLGPGNVSTVTLHALEENRFSLADLHGKLANIFSDLSSRHLEGSSIFKALTGGDSVRIERKYQSGFPITPFCRLLFSANKPPRTPDGSGAFFDRWTVIPFPNKFRGQAGETKRDKLLAALTQPSELSGLLNRALLVLPGVIERGLSVSESTRKAHEQFRAATDPVACWLEASTIENTALLVGKDDLLKEYNRDAVEAGRTPESRTGFALAVKSWRPGLKDGQRTMGGREGVRVWLGIGLRSREEREPREQKGPLKREDLPEWVAADFSV